MLLYSFDTYLNFSFPFSQVHPKPGGWGGGGGYFLVKDYWGCAAGWGHIFTTGLTIMGFFKVELLEWGRKFSGFLG